VDEDDAQDVELSLLGEEERRQAARGLGETEEQGYADEPDVKRVMSPKDQRGMALLIILCEF
jgi:MFS transporter, PAT family, solute carrier family 33 (acetyl-CoA transportor), member 1